MSLSIEAGYQPRRAAFSLDEKPSSPSVYDDEFEGSVLDPKWTRGGTPDDVNAIDQYASFASPAGWRWSLNSFRKSWYMVQPDTSSGIGNTAVIYQAVSSLPTDCFVWCRFSFNFRYSAVTASDSRVGLSLHANTGGLPDFNNRAYNYLNLSSTNIIRVQAGCNVGGVGSFTTTKNVGPQTVGTDSLSQPACYAGIQKLGTSYSFLIGWPNGNWNVLATQTLGSTIAFFGIDFINASTAAPGNMLVGVDFLRYYPGRLVP